MSIVIYWVNDRLYLVKKKKGLNEYISICICAYMSLE